MPACKENKKLIESNVTSYETICKTESLKRKKTHNPKTDESKNQFSLTTNKKIHKNNRGCHD